MRACLYIKTMNQHLPTRFTLGFAFTTDGSRVVLLEKQSPAWQRGKLNGVGGKVEPDETALEAMVREFTEETGVATEPARWRHYAELSGSAFHVDVYSLFDDAVVDGARTVEIHEVRVCPTTGSEIREKGINNLGWLIAAGLDAGLNTVEGDRIRLLRCEYMN